MLQALEREFRNRNGKVSFCEETNNSVKKSMRSHMVAWIFLTRWISNPATSLLSFYCAFCSWGSLLIFCRFNSIDQQTRFSRARDVEVVQGPFPYVASFGCKILEDFRWWGFLSPVIFDLIRPTLTVRYRIKGHELLQIKLYCLRQVFVVYRLQLERHSRFVVVPQAKFFRQLPPSHPFC